VSATGSWFPGDQHSRGSCLGASHTGGDLSSSEVNTIATVRKTTTVTVTRMASTSTPPASFLLNTTVSPHYNVTSTPCAGSNASSTRSVISTGLTVYRTTNGTNWTPPPLGPLTSYVSTGATNDCAATQGLLVVVVCLLWSLQLWP